MIEERDTSFKVDAVFLQLLQRGKYLGLYAYQDDIKIRYFISEAPDYTPTELVYRLYYDMEQVTLLTGRTVNEDTYKKQLFALAAKYDKITDRLVADLNDAEYKDYHLVGIVSKINGITKKKKH